MSPTSRATWLMPSARAMCPDDDSYQSVLPASCPGTDLGWKGTAMAEKTQERSDNGHQAARHAEQERWKADAKREKASGAAGWVADRAGQWSLDGTDYDFMDKQK